jgi:tRNA A37 threonylcarbamoyladenosine dehydratase
VKPVTARPELDRVNQLLGEEATAVLGQTRVVVVGLGGVGSWAAEALVRSGIGHITVIDNDNVCPSNINRQAEALPGTVGLPKAAALMKRLLEINPGCDVSAFNKIFSLETAGLFGMEKAAYVIDAIDSFPHKLDLIQFASGKAILFSSMGMAQKTDPTRIKAADIWETHGCPLAKVVRQGLKARGFAGHFTAVYSDEVINRKNTKNGSLVTVTAAAGMTLASLVIRSVCHGIAEHPNGGS